MHISKEVLNSVQSDLLFFNIGETLIVTDCEHIHKRKNKKLLADCIYWLDFKPVNENDFNKNGCIFLIDSKLIKALASEYFSKSKVIGSENPKHLFLAIDEYLREEAIFPEIHPTAIIHHKAIIGKNVAIGPGAVIGACYIGDNSIIHSHCDIGNGVRIGSNTIIHSGSKIGFNIFGFRQNQTGSWVKYQQIARVTIGNNVTIGSNTCINNGFMTDTIIKDDVFIDSLCQIQASVVIGYKTIISAQSFISTNVKLGDRCWVSPNVSILENINICDDVFIGIGSVVLRSIKYSCRVFGVPAKPIVI